MIKKSTNMRRKYLLSIAFTLLIVSLSLHVFCRSIYKADSNISLCSKKQIYTQSYPRDYKDSSSNNLEKSWSWFDVLQGTAANLFGGILFALVIFLIKEYLFRNKNVSGEWKMINKTTQTAYHPYKNLCVEYKVHLMQQGNQILGRAEKTKEIDNEGQTLEYQPENRIEIEIRGYYEKNYLKKSKLYLLGREHGKKRDSSTSFNLKLPILTNSLMDGNFTSTAADSKGSSNWSKIN